MNRNIIITTLLLLAAGTTTLITVKTIKAKSKTHTSKPKTPDTFVINAVYTKMDQNGNIKNILSTPFLQHYQYENSTHFKAPKITIFQKKQNPWHITSTYGTSQNGTTIINLLENVIFHQPPGHNNKELTITTNSATLYLHRKYIETDQPVTMLQPGITLKSIGAHANLKKKAISLLSKVHQTQIDKDSNLTTLDSNRADYNGNNHTGTYSGNVHYSKNSTQLKSQKLIVLGYKDSNKIQKVIAYGQPTHYSTLPKGKKYKLYADANIIEYYPLQKIIKLIGKARVKQQENWFNGNKIIYNEQKQTVSVAPAAKNNLTITFQP